MVALYMDENVHRAIIDGLRRQKIDFVTALEDGHNETPDPIVLARASALGRVLFTCDDDMLKEANRLWEAGLPFCGVLFTRQRNIDVGVCIEDLTLISTACDLEEYVNQVRYIPLR